MDAEKIFCANVGRRAQVYPAIYADYFWLGVMKDLTWRERDFPA